MTRSPMPVHVVRLCRLALLALVAMATGVHGREPGPVDPAGRTQAGPESVRIAWTFAAPPAAVWAAWTDADAVRQWFGSDPEGEVLEAELDVRPGGRFAVTFADRDGTQHTARGVYRRVEPHRVLEFSWGWDSEPGVTTAVTIRLAADGDGTRMQFEHGNLVQASSHDYASGWRSTFDKIEKVLAGTH
jgi:uncharacterized protein YndB with AHSA1/START domain